MSTRYRCINLNGGLSGLFWALLLAPPSEPYIETTSPPNNPVTIDGQDAATILPEDTLFQQTYQSSINPSRDSPG